MNAHIDKHQYEFLVIGGGIVGLMTARELLRAGAEVAVVEKGMTGMESSWAGGGILSPLYPWRDTGELQVLIDHSLCLYPQIVQELHAVTGIDPEWQKSGMLFFGISKEEEQQIRPRSAINKLRLDLVRKNQLKVMEPCLSDAFDQAFFLPEISQVRNPLLIRAMYKFLVKHGVEIHEQTEVRHLVIKNNRVTAVDTTQGMFRANIIVLANGAWGSCLLDELAIKPVRGQMICYLADPGYLKHILLKDGLYIIPRLDGHLLVGSTVEDVGFDKSTTNAARDMLINGAGELLPHINDFPLVGHWSGLRPATRTNTPYICGHPGIGNLYLNIGHYRNGLLLAPASAAMLADIIFERETAPVAGNFRFQPATSAC